MQANEVAGTVPPKSIKSVVVANLKRFSRPVVHVTPESHFKQAQWLVFDGLEVLLVEMLVLVCSHFVGTYYLGKLMESAVPCRGCSTEDEEEEKLDCVHRRSACHAARLLAVPTRTIHV